MSEQEQELDFTHLICPECGNDGWYIGHADQCHEDGDCSCSGIQVICSCLHGALIQGHQQ